MAPRARWLQVLGELCDVQSCVFSTDQGMIHRRLFYAYAAYAAHRPDWVLMDIQLPGLDGIAATAQIRAAFPDARILVVSGYGDVRLRAAAREAGACGYVLKEDLLEIRRRLVAPSQTPNG